MMPGLIMVLLDLPLAGAGTASMLAPQLPNLLGVMELITVLLAGFLATLPVAGIVADRAAESAMRSQLKKVDSIQVRIDNAPNLQILAGKADRVRLAARGMWLADDLRIEGLELETDPIQVDPQKIQQSPNNLSLAALSQPLQAGVKLVMTEQDINRAFRSRLVLQQVQKVVNDEIAAFAGSVDIVYRLEQPQVRLLANGRLGMKFTLIDVAKPADRLDLDLESGVKIIGGRKMQLLNARGTVNGFPMPDFIVESIVSNFNRRSDLAWLESRGVTARVLGVKVQDKRLEVATFVRLQSPPSK